MSAEDRVRPYHAKDPARGQESADAVAAVLKHAAERDTAANKRAPPKKPPRWLLPLGVNLAVLAVYLLIAPPAWVTVNPITQPDPAGQIESLRVAMYLQAQRIESHRVRNGQLPTDLAEAGSPIPNVEYLRQGDQFQLVAIVGSTAVVYDSTQSAAEFLGPAAARFMGG